KGYSMNRLRIKGNWKVVKGKLKQKYGDLVGDYRAEENGKEQQNAGRMLKRIAKSQEDVRATIEKYCC
ncbi:MAG: CsbD family protein, partial [Verrucomicrobiota bacterium]